MTHAQWLREAERLMHTMEQLDYKSELYHTYRARLKEHMAAKPEWDDEDEDAAASQAWLATLPGQIGVP